MSHPEDGVSSRSVHIPVQRPVQGPESAFDAVSEAAAYARQTGRSTWLRVDPAEPFATPGLTHCPPDPETGAPAAPTHKEVEVSISLYQGAPYTVRVPVGHPQPGRRALELALDEASAHEHQSGVNRTARVAVWLGRPSVPGPALSATAAVATFDLVVVVAHRSNPHADALTTNDRGTPVALLAALAQFRLKEEADRA